MKEEKPRRRVGIGFCRYILPVYFAGIFFNLTASLYSHNLLISNVLPKPPLHLGTLESTQSQPAFLQLIDYQTPSEKRNGYGVGNTVARGGKTATSGFTGGFTDKRLSERCRITKISASERIFKQFYITCRIKFYRRLMIEIKRFYFNDLRECTMVLWDETKEAVIIDPGCYTDTEKKRLEQFITDNSLKPVKILLTHMHFDHVLGLGFVTDKWKADTYMAPEDKEQRAYVPRFCEMMGYATPELPEKTLDIHDGDRITFGHSQLEVIATPGHTRGGVCFFSKENNFLISGDTLFAGSIGRTDHPSGDYDALMKSIMTKIIPLGDDIEVIPGHGYPTTIGEERLKNPFLQPY